MKSIISIISCIIFILHYDICYSQLAARQVPINKLAMIENCTKQSELVIEVHAVSSKGFKAQNHNIYTAVTYKILKIFKGNLTDSLIEVIYQGGSADGMESIVTDYYEGLAGDEGILFLNTKSDITLNKNLQSYLPGTGITYDKISHTVHCIDIIFGDIEKEIFEPIEAATEQKRKILGPNIFEIEAAKKKNDPDDTELRLMPNGNYIRVPRNPMRN